jgi:hypothetical protein
MLGLVAPAIVAMAVQFQGLLGIDVAGHERRFAPQMETRWQHNQFRVIERA